MTNTLLGTLSLLDILVIVVFMLAILWISLYYGRKSNSMSGFFLSGRNLPWYIAGTAMVATTFAADTPLAVTELVAKNGIAGNWLWWNMAIGGLLTVFFFAKLWRRAGVLTDLEFIELRYDGKPAAFLRGFRALYLGLLMNAVILGWVHKAMEKIFLVTFPGIDPFLLVVGIALFVAVYASLSGLSGTARTDSIQFVFALAGCIVFAVFIIKLPILGSLQELKIQVPEGALQFFPKVLTDGSSANGVNGMFALPLGALVAFVGLQWWASWYPGADPGGGGYIAQRMMSAKDEKQSLLATLWFNIAHYTLRPWPWLVVALAALVILPRAESPEAIESQNPALYVQVVEAYESRSLVGKTDLSAYPADFLLMYETYENTVDPGVMYPKLMVKYLPSGILGLLIAVFLAAYMSTVAAQLNWGTSYVVHDFYKRFIHKQGSEKHYVLISRLGILVMVIMSLLVSHYLLTTIKGAWEFIINASAGLGGVLLLRWFWWRVNAWSEIVAMITPVIIYLVARHYGMVFPYTLYPTVFGTTLVWVLVTLLSHPVSDKHLVGFYKRVHPGGIGWRKFAKRFPEVTPDSGYGRLLINWLLALVAVYSTLYGIGQLLFEGLLAFLPWLGIVVVTTAILYHLIGKGK
jgi:solute:Na+ symporter, SSS family